MLSPYRVLELGGEAGLLCGKVLADLGADVIKIEPPSGDPVRSQGPFYHDEADPEKSLFWFAYNANKKGITLDIETADGQEIFKKLAKTADVIVEAFPPGYLDKLRLGYTALAKLNPGVILVSITPFGQSGPYRNYKAPDIVAWALGGAMYPYGEPDRAPLRTSYHSQSYLNAGMEGAVGAMMALYHRGANGEGQWVNVSIQQSVNRVAWGVVHPWMMVQAILRRGQSSSGEALHHTQVWPCKDGFIKWSLSLGARTAAAQKPLLAWMEKEGMVNDFLREFDWEKTEASNVTQDVLEHLEEPVAKFFLTHTRAELYQWALKQGINMYPVNTTKDIMEDVQLASRDFWVKLEHPELDTAITYPGGFAQPSEAPLSLRQRAPLIGEHNEEIYQKDLGLSKNELAILKQAKVI